MRSSSAAMRRRRTAFVAFVGVLAIVLLVSKRDGPQPREVRDSPEEVDDAVRLPPSDPVYAQTDTLILVPGHGVFKGLNASDWAKEDEWGLEPFQKGHDGFLIRAFAKHIERGLLELKTRGLSTSLVVFSGGQTKTFGPRSEGLSYYIVAEINKLFGVFPDGQEQSLVLSQRLFAEEFARDSYENLLFSVCRFKEVVGVYPKKIVVVNWNYKRVRFEDFHRVAIRWLRADFEYIGIDMNDAAASLGLTVPDSMKQFSDEGTLKRVQGDMYLCKANAVTRRERNPQRRVMPYLQSCPEVKGLLLYCGPDLYDESLLPWGSVL